MITENKSTEQGEKRLADALIHIGSTQASAIPNALHQADKVLKRDRWLVRILFCTTIFFALTSITGVLAFFWAIYIKISPCMERWMMDVQNRQQPGPQSLAEQGVYCLYLIQKLSLWIVTLSMISLTLMALFMIFWIWFSRRATLRQVNVSLKDLSIQLKQFMDSHVK